MTRKYKVGDRFVLGNGKEYAITYVEPESYRGGFVYLFGSVEATADVDVWYSEYSLDKIRKVTNSNPPVTTCWALLNKETNKLDKELIFATRKEAREWLWEWCNGVKWKPVKVEVRIVASR